MLLISRNFGMLHTYWKFCKLLLLNVYTHDVYVACATTQSMNETLPVERIFSLCFQDALPGFINFFIGLWQDRRQVAALELTLPHSPTINWFQVGIQAHINALNLLKNKRSTTRLHGWISRWLKQKPRMRPSVATNHLDLSDVLEQLMQEQYTVVDAFP